MLEQKGHTQKMYSYLIIVVFFLTNLILKISFLDAEPFWYDESISIKASLLDFGHIKHMSEWDNNPPFYYYCLWVWNKCFGISEFSARFLSVLFSSVSACLLFIFAKKHLNLSIATWAAVLFTFHNFIYQYSHETRSYSLVLMLVLLSSILFFTYLEKPNYSSAILLGIVNFLIVYTHYIAGIILVIQFFFIIFSKTHFKNYALSLVIILALILIRFTKKQLIVIFSYHNAEDSFWLPKTNFHSLLETLQSLLGGKFIWPLMLALLFFGTSFIFVRYKEIISKRILLYSIFSGVTVILLLFLIGIKASVFLDRYLIFTIPFLLIIISWVIYSINKWFRLVFLLLTAGLIFNLKLNPLKPMNFRLAASVVKNLSPQPKHMILLQTKDITGLFTYYYDKKIFLDQKHLTENLKSLNIYDISNFKDLELLNLKNEKVIVFCQTFEKSEDNKLIFDYFQKNKFIHSTTSVVRGVKITLLKKL